jgi:uncharacterized protein (TIGR02266 family)
VRDETVLAPRSLKSGCRAADLPFVARNVDVAARNAAERRASSRVDLEIEVGLETDSNFYTGLTQDISTGGVFVATHNLRRRGDRLVLKFSLPGVSIPFVVDAEVRWLREATSLSDNTHAGPTGMGLKFLNPPAQVKAVITSFLKQRESIFYDDE